MQASTDNEPPQHFLLEAGGCDKVVAVIYVSFYLQANCYVLVCQGAGKYSTKDETIFHS